MTLAQRIIVMNAGVMDQFGTPEEVYARPATTFVASFIGSPPMNLLKHAPGVRAGHDPRHPARAPDARRRRLVACRSRSVELLGAERLIYGRIGDEQMIMRADESQAAAGRPATRCRSPRARTSCTGSTPAPASASHERAMHAIRLALPALDRAPRRRQAGAREHAGRLPPWRRARLSHVRVRRQAQRRRRALPAARRTLERTTNGHGIARRPALERAGPARRRRLAFARATPASRCPARSADRASACANGHAAQHRDQADAGRRAATPARRSRSTRRGCGPARPCRRPAHLLRARSAERRARGRSPSCRAACCSTRCGTAGSTPRARARLRGRSSATTRCGTPPPWRRCMPPACAR